MDNYFILSGVREYKKLNHTPFLVFLNLNDNEVQIKIVDNIIELLAYSDDTPVMAQWRGQ